MFFRLKLDFLSWCKPSSTCATCRCKRACFPVVWVCVSQPYESFSPELLSAFSAVLLSRLRLKFYPIFVNVAYMFEQTMLSLWPNLFGAPVAHLRTAPSRHGICAQETFFPSFYWWRSGFHYLPKAFHKEHPRNTNTAAPGTRLQPPNSP